MFLHSTLLALADTAPGPHISLFLPTSPFSDTTVDGALHLKNLLKDAQLQLADSGLTANEAESLLAPAEKLLSDRRYWQHQQHGLALFISRGTLTEVLVNHTLEPRAVVGEFFDVLPLMPGLTTDDSHVLVCVSQDEVAVYRVDAMGIEPITIEGMPSSLEDVLTGEDYENPVLASPPARPNLGTHSMAHSQVYGAAPPEWQAMVRRKFAGRITSSLKNQPDIQGRAMVVIADTDMAGDLASNLGSHVVVTTHPGSLTEPQRHAASWEAAAPFTDSKRLATLETLTARLGQANLVVTDPAQVQLAAAEGRVEVLAVASAVPDTAISQALWATLTMGGDVVWAGDAHPQLSTSAAALLRYE